MKKVIAISILLSLVLAGCAGMPKKETKKLKWAVFDLYAEMRANQKSVNEMLKKKGLPYEIEFVNISTDFEGDYEACADAHLKEVKTGTYDIITCPNPLNCYDLYKMMADEGILLSLNDFLENDGEGKKLKEAYPLVVWEAVEYKEEIYGVLTPDMQMNYYAVFNKKYADKYGIDLSQVTFASLGKGLQAACAEKEGRGEENPFAVSTGWPYYLMGEFEFSPCQLICIDTGEDVPVAENILYNEEFLEHIKKLGDWGREGVFSEDEWEAVGNGEFLVTGVYAYSPEAAECMFRNTSNVPADTELQAVELPEFNKAFYRGGGKTGVKKDGADPEGALEVLAAIYSDADLSNALVYGKEGVDYQVKDGIAVRRSGDWMTEFNMKTSLGNPFLTMPGFLDTASKNEEIWSLAESAPLAVREKISFDIDGIDQEICQLNLLVLDTYVEYFTGRKDMEEMLDTIRKEAEEAGIEKVLVELNSQLKLDW